MKNVEKLAHHVIKTGAKNIIIHTMPGSRNWLVANKINSNKWEITLMNPSSTIEHKLGTINNAKHIKLWETLLRTKIQNRINQEELAQKLKDVINNFKKSAIDKEKNGKPRKSNKSTQYH